MTDVIRRFVSYPPLLALLMAVVLFFAGGLISPGFVNVAQAINIVRLAAFLGIIAAGQTLVIISGNEGIDLSVGAIVTLGAILTFRITNGDNALILPALGVVLLVGTGIGLINGIGIIVLRIAPLVMTLAMAGVVEGLVLVVTRGELIGDTPELMSNLIARPLFFGIPGVIVIWIVFGLGMWLLLERTQYGKQLFAVGVNRTTAKLSGIRVPFVVILTFAPERCISGVRRLYFAWFHTNRVPESGRPLSVSIHRGSGCRRHAALRRQR